MQGNTKEEGANVLKFREVLGGAIQGTKRDEPARGTRSGNRGVSRRELVACLEVPLPTRIPSPSFLCWFLVLGGGRNRN